MSPERARTLCGSEGSLTLVAYRETPQTKLWVWRDREGVCFCTKTSPGREFGWQPLPKGYPCSAAWFVERNSLEHHLVDGVAA